jgi:hypothetical protein
MQLLRSIHRQLIRGLHAIQKQPPSPPSLQHIHVESAKLVTERTELLRRLPIGGTVMECGVDEGNLSRQILQITKPHQLILVDTWSTQRFNASKLEKIQQEFTEEIAESNHCYKSPTPTA